MDTLKLVRVRAGDTAFLQYVPQNFHVLLERPRTLCVGAVYKNMACAAALAEETEPARYHLRYLYVDPKARLCGLGTYLLRGLLGCAKEMGAEEVVAMYDAGMLEGGGQTLSVLVRAGFSQPKAASTAFTTRLGDISCPVAAPPEGTQVYSAEALPEAVCADYQRLTEGELLPPYVNLWALERPVPQLCSFCVVDGTLSGVMLVDEWDGGLRVAGCYVLEPFRRGRTASLLIQHTLAAAQALYPPETPVETSAISRESFALCDKLLRRGRQAQKRTEFISRYLL